MDKQISIKMEQHGERGWKWTETITQYGETEERSYCTNENGRGLWIWTHRNGAWSADDMDWKQVSGTSQFRLSRHRDRAYAKIRRLALKD